MSPRVCRCFSAEAAAPKQATLQGPSVNLRFVSSSDVLIAKPVYMVTIPAVSGVMGVLGDHAPTIAQLKPGVVTVHGMDVSDIIARYFVSGGFATIKADSSATVNAVEAIKFEDLDAGLARKGLDDANAALAKAGGEQEKALAQIAIEVNEAILQALEAK